jgi:lysophospholipase L1-like esterase
MVDLNFMTKRLLFIGDSITEGKIGLNWVDMIKHRFPDFICHNEGNGGETLLEVTTRLIKILIRDKHTYDFIIIEAGHNDLILPYVKQKWPFMSVKQVTPVSEIGELLEKQLNKVISLTKAKIIMTTLSCIGEIYNSQINQERRLINKQIKSVGYKYNAIIADVSPIFDKTILHNNSSSYLMDNPLNLLIDYFRSKKSKWADKISKKRNLSLTIDGGHLNSKGARIYCQVITEVLNKIK